MSLAGPQRGGMAIAISACLLVAACGGASSGASNTTSSKAASGGSVAPLSQMTPLSFGSVGGLAIMLTFPQSVAMDQGFFRKNNVDFSVVNEASVQNSCSALIGGAVGIAECTPNLRVPAVLQGSDIVQFDDELGPPNPYWIAVKSGTTWDSLKGQTVTLSAPQDSPMYFLDQMASKAGLKGSDFKFSFAGSTGARYAALQGGSVQGALLSAPTSFVAQSSGFKLLASTLNAPGLSAKEFSGGGMVVSKKWAATHQSLLLAYLRSIQEAIKWINNPANETAVKSEMTKTYALTSDTVASDTYKAYVGGKIFNDTLCASTAAEEGAIKPLVSLGAIPKGNYPAGNYFTNSYVDTLNGKSCPK